MRAMRMDAPGRAARALMVIHLRDGVARTGFPGTATTLAPQGAGGSPGSARSVFASRVRCAQGAPTTQVRSNQWRSILRKERGVVAETARCGFTALSDKSPPSMPVCRRAAHRAAPKPRQSGVYLKVAKNTLVARAVEGTDYACVRTRCPPPLYAFSKEDPGAAGRLIGFRQGQRQAETTLVAIGGEALPGHARRSAGLVADPRAGVNMFLQRARSACHHVCPPAVGAASQIARAITQSRSRSRRPEPFRHRLRFESLAVFQE